MSWPQIGATQYHEQLGLPDKGHVIKRLVVCNDWDLEPLDLLNALALIIIIYLDYYTNTNQVFC